MIAVVVAMTGVVLGSGLGAKSSRLGWLAHDESFEPQSPRPMPPRTSAQLIIHNNKAKKVNGRDKREQASHL